VTIKKFVLFVWFAKRKAGKLNLIYLLPVYRLDESIVEVILSETKDLNIFLWEILHDVQNDREGDSVRSV